VRGEDRRGHAGVERRRLLTVPNRRTRINAAIIQALDRITGG
jgi:hypothetical protein